jgi:CheY-like chemotaxis protein
MPRILIVEDAPEMAKLLVRYLQPVAREIIVAESMEHAFAVINQVNPFDIVTLDLNLPDSRTEETRDKIREIKRINPDALVVVITGVVRPEEQERIIAAGADGYVYKVDIMGQPTKFWQTLSDVLKSVVKTPTRYTKNVAIMERLNAAIATGFEENTKEATA